MATAEHIGRAPLKTRIGWVVTASAAGTVFEWYDFFIFGSLAAIIAKHFFTSAGDVQGYIFALLTFAAGFFVRPFGAVVFGHIGDRTGRKRAFLVTITIMGVATFAVGFLPDYNSIGLLAPWLLVLLRVAQGFAVGGEYGGAAIYVAEHASPKNRGQATGWIQVSASLGLLLALGVIYATRTIMGEDQFNDWGWRIPFLVSVLLLAISLWIRLQLDESPVFRRIQEEGATSQTPLSEAFLQWPNSAAGADRAVRAADGARRGLVHRAILHAVFPGTRGEGRACHGEPSHHDHHAVSRRRCTWRLPRSPIASAASL